MPGIILLNPITGTVNLSEPITGTVGLSGPITGAVKITEVVTVTGSVIAQITGFTLSASLASQVDQGNSGSQAWKVEVSNFPLSSSITGTVGLSGPITGNVGVTNFPAVQAVTGTVGLSGPITGNVGVTNFPAVQGVTGSVGITGPLTGNFGLSGPITGAVKLTEPVVVSNFPTGFNVAITASVALTASVTGTVGLSGPITGTVGLSGPITGTVAIAGPVTGAFKITEAVKTASGSLVGILIGGEAASAINPMPVTGTIGVVGTVTISGSSNVSGTVVVNGPGLASSRAGFCFGKVDTSVGGEQIIEHTVYTEMTGNFKLSLSSVSGTDTVAAGGTGARLVKVTWYDVTGSGPFTETVQLSGTTAVPLTASTTCYIEKMEVLTVGSYGTNKGTISLKIGATGAGATVGSILGNHGKTYWAHHYIPSGTTCFITGMYGAHFNNTSAGSGGTYFIRYKDFSRTDSANVQLTDYLNAYGQSSAPVRVYGTPIRVTGPARLSMYVFPDGALTETFVGSFDFYEQDNV